MKVETTGDVRLGVGLNTDIAVCLTSSLTYPLGHAQILN